MSIELLLLLLFHPPVLQKRRAAAAAAHGDESFSTTVTVTNGAASFVYCYVLVALAAVSLYFFLPFDLCHHTDMDWRRPVAILRNLFGFFTPSHRQLSSLDTTEGPEQKHRNLELISFFFSFFFPRTTHTQCSIHISNDVNNK